MTSFEDVLFLERQGAGGVRWRSFPEHLLMRENFGVSEAEDVSL